MLPADSLSNHHTDVSYCRAPHPDAQAEDALERGAPYGNRPIVRNEARRLETDEGVVGFAQPA